jgi:membrane dipeptidase
MLIVDAHLDLAWNALQWNRNLLCSAHTIRTTERTSKINVPGLGMGAVALPEMRSGRVALSFVTLLAKSSGNPIPHSDFGSPAQAYGIARGQLAYYEALQAEGHARIITTVSALDSHIAEWKAWEQTSPDSSQPPLGFIITMESADPILRPEQVPQWYQSGLRIIGPGHYGVGRYAGGHDTEVGLNGAGRMLLRSMADHGLVLDVTHLSDQSFWEALDLFSGTVLASHSNCRALVPHQRQLSDEQLRAIIERGGVIGVAVVALMLKLGWILGKSSNQDITLEHVVDHIDHVCQLAGNCDHVALGTDLDGGCGIEAVPRDMDTIADLQKLPALLKARGYVDADIERFLHGNWIRLLHDARPVEAA